MPGSDNVNIDCHFSSSTDVDQWSCPTCSFNNRSTSYPTCEMCHQIDSQLTEDPSISNSFDMMWRCASCSWKNDVNYVVCESCYQTKLSSEYIELDSKNRSLVPLTSSSIIVRNSQTQFDTNLEIKFQEIISYCKKVFIENLASRLCLDRKVKIHFVDDQFIPSTRSLGSNTFKNVSHWLRISDISPSFDTDRHLSWSVISSPQPSDIEQGALGNCWFMAALALITERPRILKQILLTQTVNNEGIYLVRLCHNGLWKTMIVDDCFPCTTQKKLVFSQARRRQLYVPLIEKACAKLFGSYASLTSGNMLESLQLLTGAPCDHINLQSSDQRLDSDIIWAKLLSACESNLLIGASSGRTDVSAKEYSEVRIHANHAFSILATHALVACSSRFVLVRDPHARSNYTDKYVTSTVLKQLRLINDTPRSSGAFWISWSTFLRFFASITISTYNEDHYNIRYEGQFTRSSTQYVPTYRFHVTETSLISISLVYHRYDRTTSLHHTQSFVLCDIDKEAAVGGIGRYENILESRKGGFTYWTGSLRPGNYILIPFSISLWGQDTPINDYTVVIHSSIPLDMMIASEPPTLLTDCLISAVVKKYHISTEGKEMTYYVTPKGIHSMLLIVENWSSSCYLSIDTNMIYSKNIQLSRYSTVTHDCIPPYHRQLIFIAEWTGEHRSSSSPTYNFSYERTTHLTVAKPAVSSYLDDLHTPRLF